MSDQAVQHAGPPCILVVDDEPHIRALLTRALEGEGYRVEAAPNAMAALPLVRGGVDLVISDIMMPGMPGTVLLRTLRDLDPDVPVLLITGNPTVETVLEAKQNGAVDYIRKPINLDDLGRRVRAAVSRRRKAPPPRIMVLGESLTAELSTALEGFEVLTVPGEGDWEGVPALVQRWRPAAIVARPVAPWLRELVSNLRRLGPARPRIVAILAERAGMATRQALFDFGVDGVVETSAANAKLAQTVLTLIDGEGAQ